MSHFSLATNMIPG